MGRRINSNGAIEPLCYTIPEFCRAHRLAVKMYWKLREEGRAPLEIRISAQKVLITKESAKRWRRAREAEAAKSPAECQFPSLRR